MVVATLAGAVLVVSGSPYAFLRDQGSGIGGVLALLAGVLAYLAGREQAKETRDATDRQIAQLRSQARAEGRGIAVAVYNELLELDVVISRVRRRLEDEDSVIFSEGRATLDELIVELPPLLDRFVERFYLVQPGCDELLQLVSQTAQFNRLIVRAGKQNRRPLPVILGGHLEAMATALASALRDVAILHDDAGQGAT